MVERQNNEGNIDNVSFFPSDMIESDEIYFFRYLDNIEELTN